MGNRVMNETGAKTIRVLKVRVRDKHASELSRMAADVNLVWNYLNELSTRAIRDKRQFLSGYDLQKYLSGASRYLCVSADTINEVAKVYARNRNTAKKRSLKWRKSKGSRRSLGWIPIKTHTASWSNQAVKYFSKGFEVWDSYGLDQHKFRSGSFNEDARGRWYFNVAVEAEVTLCQGSGSIGIDLGCKDAANCSTGEKLQGRWYREGERKLAKAQRARKKKEAKNIQAKIANRRKDAMHKFSRKLVNENAAIFVGNVSSSKLAKTRLAKSTYDASWGMLKIMLEYKCAHAGIVFEVIDEAYTTQTCSSCGCLPAGRPKGIAGLGIREWTCECGVTHDRDVNAAKNILALGHGRLAGGMAKSLGAKLLEHDAPRL